METISLEIHKFDITKLKEIIKQLEKTNKKNHKVIIKLDFWDNIKECMIK